MKIAIFWLFAFLFFSSVILAEERSKPEKPVAPEPAAVENPAPVVPTLPAAPTFVKKKVKNKASLIPEGITPADVIAKINEGNKAMQKVREKNDYCAICELNKKTETSGHTEVPAREAIAMKNNPEALMEPKTDENSINTFVSVCKAQGGGIDYDLCTYNGDVVPGQIRLFDRTKALRREWRFYSPGQARQDIGFSISDANDEHVSQSKETYMMVFPRRYLPSTRVEGGQQIVTLATGEKVVFDAKTKRIVSGALTNEKTYSGPNVVVRVDGTGNDPRFSKSTVTITKNGKTCKGKVPAKGLWPDQSDNSKLHFKYASDTEFDEFLKKTCGFSMF